MRIAITGANGFLGKNLFFNLILNNKDQIFKITRNTKKKEIENILKNIDIIFHLAAVNRATKSKTFKNDNVKFTKYICEFLEKNKLKPLIVFSSTTQVNKNNEYGYSKKECEKILRNFSKKNESQVAILRLPNIFGKWSKPNYNSVVSTFCYNISRKKN